ncbi:MAG: prolipoprotein diacylglyceryl transferase [Gammaproteobacteria bacterium]|nr:MAG: prolipoprotein diacylglyceryl transferase [Gammaproteobacteria bacterium]UCH40216.1 MAG: prolipoprotein diacylglyceryl transferase [Gammaproteobacteria bacterium]
MFGPFVHDIDPIFAEIGGLYLWWYGASYSFGFVAGFIWLRAHRSSLAFSHADVYRLIIYIAVGVLLGGRVVEVIFYEWAYYGEHPWHIPAIWLGGMSTHGILLGSTLAVLLFCQLNRRSFLEVGDVLVFAAAFIMGFGRLGNFVDGQIVGSLTQLPWGVKFPDLDGFRHPVVLYDGLKNLLLIPLLLLIKRSHPPGGVLVAHFILWYGFLRIFIDFFREYRSSLFGLPPGQEFNLLMTLLGVGMLVWLYRRERHAGAQKESYTETVVPADNPRGSLWPKRVTLAILLFLPTVMPSDWTQDVPARYGDRHPGISYSKIYPQIKPGG